MNEAINTAAYLQVDKKLFREKVFLSAGVRYEQIEVAVVGDVGKRD